MSNNTTLQEAASARRAKLAALKKRKGLHDTGSHASVIGSSKEEGSESEPQIDVFKFRNYDPDTGTARKHLRTDEHDTVERQVQDLATKVLAQDEATRAQELDLSNIQPKKANWDLKRDLDRRLAKLRAKTDSAISQLIRQRLQAEKTPSAAAQVGLVGRFESEGEEEDSD